MGGRTGSLTLTSTRPVDWKERFAENWILEEKHWRDAFYRLPEAERARVVAANPARGRSNDPRSAGLHEFVRPMSDAQLRALLRGGTLRLPWSSLTRRQRDFVHQEYRQVGLTGRAGVTQPDDLEFLRLSGYAGDTSVFLHLGAVGAHAVLGGIPLTDVLRGLGERGWRQPGDVVTLAGDARLRVVRGIPEARTVPDAAFLLGALGGRQVLADAGSRVGLRSAIPPVGKASDILRQLEGEADWKVRNAILFVRPRDWLDFSRTWWTAWPARRELRESAAANDGYLASNDWLNVADGSPLQLLLLQPEFPDLAVVAGRNVKPLLQLGRRMTPGERSKAQTAAGSGWSDWSTQTRRVASELLGPSAVGVRIRLEWRVTGKAHEFLYSGTGNRSPRRAKLQPRVDPEPGWARGLA